jgi:uncharacterized protein YifE (UPF0438 family)
MFQSHLSRQDVRQRKLFHTMSQSHLSTDRISDNGNYCIRYLSLTWVQTGYQTTEVISYDVSVSPEYRQDTRQRKLFHTMSQSHLSTDRISENGSYFIRCLSLTWVQTGNETTKVISCDVSVAPKYRQDIRKRQLFHTMSQSHLCTDRISDNGSYFIRCLSLTWVQTGYQTTEAISDNGHLFYCASLLTWAFRVFPD